MSDNVNVSSGGVSGMFLLGIMFVGLKLTGFISWSWPMVTLPFWGPLVLVLGILVVCLVIWALVALGILAYTKYKER